MENRNKILVVEDDPLMVKILEFILIREGYELTVVTDGVQAIEKIPQLMPDIILTDIILPFKSGLEVISFSKENYNKIPVVVVSKMGEEEGTVLKAFDLGADDFVSKPFNPNELKIRVKRLLANSRLG